MKEHILAIVVSAPAAAALAMVFVPEAQKAVIRWIAIVGAAIAFAGSIVVALGYDLAAGGLQMPDVLPLVPAYGIALRFAVDGWGVALFVLTGLIVFAGVLASLKLEERQKEFFIFLLTLSAGVFGVFVSQDLFIFFLFYEIAVLPMYLLIGIWGSSHAITEAGPFKFIWRLFQIGDKQYAAMKLTLMLLIGSALILVAILAMYRAAGSNTFDMAILGSHPYSPELQKILFPLVWLGFGTLAGVFPFHTWSPDGHASAPTAVSMLHAGVLMKLGAFGVMRIGMVMLPEGAAAWVPVVGVVAVINIVYGAFCAMGQKDLKYIVAYSSVSHMGVVMLGAATLTQDGWNGAVYQMVAHGVMTGLFFLLVGVVYERSHTRHIPSMGGFARVMPGAAAFFTLACLSSLGLPGTAGFVAELLVFLGAWKSAHSWWALPAIFGAFITAIYALRASRAIFWGAGPSEKFEHLHDARGVEWPALWILGLALVAFGVWPRLMLDFIDPASHTYLARVAAAADALALIP